MITTDRVKSSQTMPDTRQESCKI